MDFVITIKGSCAQRLVYQEEIKEITWRDQKVKTRVRYSENLILNASNQELLVHYFDCEQTEIKSEKRTFYNSWITNIFIREENIAELVEVGRSRWKIENETFNTLKNQGYQLEHNFGHGTKYLSSVFALLMLLAFFIDQLAQASDIVFKKAMSKFKTRAVFWKRVGAVFDLIPSMSMNSIYKFIAGDIQISFPKLE